MSPELLEEEVFLVAAGGATAFLTTLYTVKEFSGSQPLAWTPRVMIKRELLHNFIFSFSGIVSFY